MDMDVDAGSEMLRDGSSILPASTTLSDHLHNSLILGLLYQSCGKKKHKGTAHTAASSLPVSWASHP